jgi:hypothetical protein
MATITTSFKCSPRHLNIIASSIDGYDPALPIASRSSPRRATFLRAPAQFVLGVLDAEVEEHRAHMFAAAVVNLDVITGLGR